VDTVVSAFPVPFDRNVSITQLYYHNHDSVFLFIDRYHVLTNRSEGGDLYDFYLLDRKGVIINQYSLNQVPFIDEGVEAPTLFLRPSIIENNKINGTRLFLPFSIYHPPLHDTIHKTLKMQLICKFDLVTGNIEMLNVFLPDELIGDKLVDRANASGPEFILHHDSVLIYFFWSSPSIFVYNLNTNSSYLAYTSNHGLFSNARTTNRGDYLVRFGEVRYSNTERLFLRKISVTDYKHFEPFEVNHVFDHAFKELGLFYVNQKGVGELYFDRAERLSLMQQEPRVQYHIKLKQPRWRTIGYFEDTYLTKTAMDSFDENLMHMNYHDRMKLYLNRFGFPDSSRILVYSLDGACSNVLNYFMETYRESMHSFQENNVYYLFFDADVDALRRTINAYQVDNSMILIDTSRLFLKYLMPKEYSLHPLVRYHNNDNIGLFFFDRDVLPIIFKGFMGTH
jgi:hypothetical protein